MDKDKVWEKLGEIAEAITSKEYGEIEKVVITMTFVKEIEEETRDGPA